MRYVNDVMNDQRKIIYEQRMDTIKSKDSYDFLKSSTEEIAKRIVLTFKPTGSYREDCDIENLSVELHRFFAIKFDLNLVSKNDVTEEEVTKIVIGSADDIYKAKEEVYSPDLMHNAVKYILLTNLDQVWKDHLYSLDHLRQGISLRAYAEKDPLSEYKREAFNLFEQMLGGLKELFIQTVYHFHIDLKHIQKEDVSLEHKKFQKHMRESREDPAFSKYNAGSSWETDLKPVIISRIHPKDRNPNDPSSWGRVSRNELCPCGSGKKYKYCHGVNE